MKPQCKNISSNRYTWPQ